MSSGTRSQQDDGQWQRPSGDLGRDVHRTEDDAPALPLLMRSGGSKRRGTWRLDTAADALPAGSSDDRNPRSMSTSAAER